MGGSRHGSRQRAKTQGTLGSLSTEGYQIFRYAKVDGVVGKDDFLTLGDLLGTLAVWVVGIFWDLHSTT